MGRPKGSKSGTPEARRAALSKKMYAAVTASRMAAIMKRLLELTASDDQKISLKATEMILDRILGVPDKNSTVQVSGLVSPGNRVLLAAIGDEKMIKAGQALAELLSKKLTEGSK